MLILLCVAIPVGVVLVVSYIRSQYGDEVFNLGEPPHDLNRDDDYRIIKTRLDRVE